MYNRPEMFEALYACFKMGCAAVPINFRLHPKEFAFIIDHSRAGAVIVSPELSESLMGIRELIPSARHLITPAGASGKLLDYESLLSGETDRWEDADVCPDDSAWLFYTSGTTGAPKGAMLTHRNLLAMIMGYYADICPGFGSQDVILHAPPGSPSSSRSGRNCGAWRASGRFRTGTCASASPITWAARAAPVRLRFWKESRIMEERPFSDLSYQQFLDEEKLMGSRCRKCGALSAPPRPICIHCHESDMEWVPMSGFGKLAAYTCVAIGPPSMIAEGYDRKNPYCVGVVELDEGVRVDARIEGVNARQPETIQTGLPLQVVFLHRGEDEKARTCLAFEPLPT